MNLFRLSKILEGLMPLTIHNDRCIRQVSPLATCRKCEDICPHGALFGPDGQWQLAEDLCSNCGLCVIVCPNQVFQLEEHFLQQQSLLNTHLRICCYQMALPQNNIFKINCLQQLYPELIFQLLTHVQQLTIYLDEAQCKSCVNGWYPPGLLLQLQQFALPLDKLALLDYNALIHEAPVEDQAANTNRRSFLVDCLDKVKHSSQKIVAQSVDGLLSLSADGTDTTTALPQIKVASRRQGLFHCLLESEQPINQQHTLPYRQLQIDHCTFCGACVRLCPTAALSFSEEEDVKTLRYQPQLCLGCNLCIDLCLQKQIYWSDQLTIAQFSNPLPISLIEGTQAICDQCEQPFWDNQPEATTCSFCRKS